MSHFISGHEIWKAACLEALQDWCEDHGHPPVALHDLRIPLYDSVGQYYIELPWEPALGLPTEGTTVVQLYAQAEGVYGNVPRHVTIARLWDDRHMFVQPYRRRITAKMLALGAR